MDTKELVRWIEELIRTNNLDRFYHSKYFRKVKREVLREQHFECQRCKEQGKLTIVKESKKRSGVIHHNMYVREHPELALSKYYIDDKGIKQRNLIILCNECHEIVHDRFSINEDKYINVEKW